MNKNLIIIGVILCILLVVFGRDPGDEMKKAKLKAMEGKDPLIEAIKEHNSKGIGILKKKDGEEEEEDTTGALDNPREEVGGGVIAPAPPGSAPGEVYHYPSYLVKPNDPSRQKTGSAASTEPPEPEGYYPPPPLPDNR